MKNFQGNLNGKGLKIGIVVSKFNRIITDRLLEGALNTLEQLDVSKNDIDIVFVPGSFEIPVITNNLLSKNRYDAIICLGTLIRGNTTHFEYLSTHITRTILDLSIRYSKPVIFGIITANSLDEAIERAGAKMGNKGSEAAFTAVEMANVLKNLV